MDISQNPVETISKPASPGPALSALANLRISAATLRSAHPVDRMLPPMRDEQLSRSGALSVARRLTRELRRGTYRPQVALQVPIPKRSGGTRPAAVLTLEDRAVYRALTASMGELMERALCGREIVYGPRGTSQAHRWLSFERAVVRTAPRWVVIADIADCHSRLSHRLVSGVLRAQGGGAPVDALESLLATLMRADHGLPQGFRASSALASVGLSPVDRAMVARGWRHVRCSDDFRIAAASVPAAARALSHLREALGAVGLGLRPEKTSIVSGEEYLRSLAAGAPWEVWMWRHLAPLLEARVEGGRLASLGSRLLQQLRATRRGRAAALRTLDQAAGAAGGDTSPALVRSALAILLTAREPAVLDGAIPLLLAHPAETPLIAACLRGLSRSQSWHQAADVSEQALSGPWRLEASQRAWLLWALQPSARRLSHRMISLIRDAIAQDEWVSRLQAAWLLESRGELEAGLRSALRAEAPAPLRAALPPPRP